MSGLSNHRELLDKDADDLQGSGDFGRTTETAPADSVTPPTTELADQLQFTADFLSEKLFSPVLGVTLPPVMIVTRRRHWTAGTFINHVWCQKSETSSTIAQIDLNPAYFQDTPTLLQILAHELSHHAQDAFPEIFGKPGKGAYHNKAWAALLERLGLRPISLDKPGKKTGYRVTEEAIAGGPFASVYAAYVAAGATVSWATSGPQRKNVRLPEDLRRTQKNKTAFRCPKCGQKTYGQPTLKVGCWICHLQMVSTPQSHLTLAVLQSNSRR